MYARANQKSSILTNRKKEKRERYALPKIESVWPDGVQGEENTKLPRLKVLDTPSTGDAKGCTGNIGQHGNAEIESLLRTDPAHAFRVETSVRGAIDFTRLAEFMWNKVPHQVLEKTRCRLFPSKDE